MRLSTIFKAAASLDTGFQAEQYLSRRGFYEIGRRTNAAAWSVVESNEVIRLSEDAFGSQRFFALAQEMKGNPYMPVIFGQSTLGSGDHIAHVEKLENPSQKIIFSKLKQVRSDLKAGVEVDEDTLVWKKEIESTAITTKRISDFFMASDAVLNIDSLPHPAAFREASVAILELSKGVHEEDRRYVPGPDMNPTNIMWRRKDGELQPVLYDPLIRQDDNGQREIQHTNTVREKFGISPIGFK